MHLADDIATINDIKQQPLPYILHNFIAGIQCTMDSQHVTEDIVPLPYHPSDYSDSSPGTMSISQPSVMRTWHIWLMSSIQAYLTFAMSYWSQSVSITNFVTTSTMWMMLQSTMTG